MIKLLIAIFLTLCIPLILILLEKKEFCIYIKGAKIPSKYWKEMVFIWIGGFVGMIVGIILSKILSGRFTVIVSIIIFIFLSLFLSKKYEKTR
jgi:uncharacterized protein YacL